MVIKWLSDVKKGKYKGIQQAGILYSYGEQYPEYIELTIHELMEKLNHDNDIIRKNAFWMISKISDQLIHHTYLTPIIPILKFGIKREKREIRRFSLETLNNLAQTMPKRLLFIYNEILDIFDEFEKDNQILALKVLIQLSEHGKSIPNNEFFLKYIENKKLSRYIISLLIYKDSYKTIFSSILSNLQKNGLANLIFDFIDEASNKRPLKIILALKKTLLKMDPLIRQNSLIILSQNPNIKNNPKIYLILPELLKLIRSKIRAINRISLFLLYDIHKIIIEELFFYSDELLRIRKTGDKAIKIVIKSILIDMACLDIRIIKKYKKKIYKTMKRAKNSDDIRFSTIATLAYSKIILWIPIDKTNKEIYQLALNSCLDLTRKYPIHDYKYEMFERISILNYYIENFSKAKEFLQKAINSEENIMRSYKSWILLILLNFIVRLPKTARETQSNFKREYEDIKLPKRIKKEISIWNEIFEDLYHIKIENAKSKLKSYYRKVIIKNKWEHAHIDLFLKDIDNMKSS
ncbi:MAG: hypothetical protein GF329_22660 [Candidatus Lokiarchaeota archaeon]|nr:hypothetical protein [Candidatus Lokiarchaeota archaeon]